MAVIMFHSPDGVGIHKVRFAADVVDVGTVVCPTLQEFCSGLYRDPEAFLGVLAGCFPRGEAVSIIREMRAASIQRPLLVLALQGGPLNLADLLWAGADDAQPLNIDERELAARIQRWRFPPVVERRVVVLPSGARYDPGRAAFISRDGDVHPLSPMQDEIWNCILASASRFVSISRLRTITSSNQAARTHLYHIRSALCGATGGIDVLRSERGAGIWFVPEGFPRHSRADRGRMDA